MTRSHAHGHWDALVFFGGSADLAYKQIFPPLAALVARQRLDMPVIEVARSGWDMFARVETLAFGRDEEALTVAGELLRDAAPSLDHDSSTTALTRRHRAARGRAS